MARARLAISLSVETQAWAKAWPGLKREIPALIRKAGSDRRLKPAPGGLVAVVLADDAALKRLNRQFRGKNKATNVLSFPDVAEPLGGMALAYETVDREAQTQNKPFINHAKHLILHGFLHLLGYDHMTKAQAALMEQIETAILNAMGIPDPYIIETHPRA